MIKERYFLSTDGDGHWFVVPLSKKDHWIEWLGLAGEDEAAWTPPDYAKKVGGSPSLVTFESFKIG